MLNQNPPVAKPSANPKKYSSDVLQVVKIIGYENFAPLQLPDSRFWDESRQQAAR